jgi:outer membrane protein insertion porin family
MRITSKFILILLAACAFVFQNLQSTTLAVEEYEEELFDPSNRSAVYIREVEIVGNNLVDANFIREQIIQKDGEMFDRGGIASDLRNIYNTGFFTQKMRAVPVQLPDGSLKLRIVVEENPPITGFSIDGNSVVSTGEIMRILNPLKGKPQNILALDEAREQIQELYATKGYILARIVGISDDPDGFVNITIDEGVIEDVIVEGIGKTKDFIIRRNILLAPGTVYNENVTRADIMKLMGLQAFQDVRRDIEMNPQTGQYNVIITLEEQRTGRLSLGVGLDSSSGFFGSVGFGENNFRGLGQKLNLNIMAGTGVMMSDDSVLSRPNLQAELSFYEPYFRNPYDALAVRGFARNFGSHQVLLAIEERFGADVTLFRRFQNYRNLTGSLALGAEHVSLREGDFGKISNLYAAHGIDPSVREEQLTGGLFVKLTPGLTYDTRDTALNTRRGVLANVSLEEALSINTPRSYGKLSGGIRKFVPAGRKSTLVVSARGGGRLHGTMPEFAGFSLGGPYSVRGFNVAEVGTGSGFMMGSAEFRTPIPFVDRMTTNTFLQNIRLAAFLDAGKVFAPKSLADEIYNRPGQAITAGVGLRVFIPGLGPVNLDYGFPLTNTKGSRSTGFFTFGMGEMMQ